MRECTQRTGCLNRVVDWTLQSQLFLNELYKEHPGWASTQKQEWGLFMLECLLHNMAAMQKREHQRHSLRSEPEMAEWAPEHPSMQTLLGSPDELLKVV